MSDMLWLVVEVRINRFREINTFLTTSRAFHRDYLDPGCGDCFNFN